MYVLVEGIDTAGKSTLVELLSKFENVVATKEPGGTPLGKEIRSLILEKDIPRNKGAELFLFLADRSDHYEQIVKPNRQTKIVVSDRGYISGMSYALTRGGFSYKNLLFLNTLALEGDLPDKIIMLKTNEELLRQRLVGKNSDAIEARGIDYLLQVQETMEKLIKESGKDFLLIDSKLSKEEIWTLAAKFIGI